MDTTVEFFIKEVAECSEVLAGFLESDLYSSSAACHGKKICCYCIKVSLTRYLARMIIFLTSG